MNLQVSPLLSNIKLNNERINSLGKSKESKIQNQIKEIKENQELTFKMIESIKKKSEMKLKYEIDTKKRKVNENNNSNNINKFNNDIHHVNDLEESMNSIKMRSFKALDDNLEICYDNQNIQKHYVEKSIQ